MQIKICGITSIKDAHLAVNLGAWALGFNFYLESSRYLSPEAAASIISQLPNTVKKVGVFVNASLEYILAVQNKTKINIVQLHGDESLEFCKKLPFPVIKAIRLHDHSIVDNIKQYQGLYALLIDAYDEKQYGGTGKKANWFLAKSIAKKFPTILAGGIDAKNIKSAILTVKPIAIDVCSGLEKSPGKKSPQKMIEFFNAIKQREN